MLAAASAPAQQGDVLREAAAAYESGDMGGAIRFYREFLKDHPDAAEIRSNLGAALVRDGQFGAAIEEYEAALKALPSNTKIRMNLALAYFKLGRFDDAVKGLEKLREQDPLERNATLLLADCLLETGQARKAAEALATIQEEYPDDHAVVYMLGMALLKDNRPVEAQRMLDRILRDGESAEAAYLMGQTEFMRQDVLAAAKHLKRAVELNPRLPGAHSLYGQVLRGLGQLDAAEAQFREELKVNEFDFVANSEMAMTRKQEGKFDEALVHLSRALQARPADAGVLFQRANIRLRQGHTEQAREELEGLVRDHPEFLEAHAALATAYYKLGRNADGDRERAIARGGAEPGKAR